MSQQKPLVRNASTTKQVKSAEEHIKDRRDKELNDLRVILNRPEGRRVLWRLLSNCKTFGSVWRPSAEIHYLSGKQDVGHFWMSEIGEADEKLLFQMMKENKKGDN